MRTSTVPPHDDLTALRQQGLSQVAIGRMYGVAQATVSKWLRRYNGEPIRSVARRVDAYRRDGRVQRPHASDVWEPCRVLHPTVAKWLSEHRMFPAGDLDYLGGVDVAIYDNEEA